MAYQKTNYQPNQRVKCVRAGLRLEGMTGTVIGVAAEFAEMAYYIVELDDKVPYSVWRAFCLTEHCLESI